jgi:hypothetical protein
MLPNEILPPKSEVETPQYFDTFDSQSNDFVTNLGNKIENPIPDW